MYVSIEWKKRFCRIDVCWNRPKYFLKHIDSVGCVLKEVLECIFFQGVWFVYKGAIWSLVFISCFRIFKEFAWRKTFFGKSEFIFDLKFFWCSVNQRERKEHLCLKVRFLFCRVFLFFDMWISTSLITIFSRFQLF